MSTATAPSQSIPTAAETDPQTLGWMQGFPPPLDKTITFHNGSFRSFPKLRWAWSNIRQLVPTVNVWRGAGPVSVLPRAEQDIGASASVTMDGRPMTFERMLEETYADGIAVLHRGKLIYERYFGALKPHKPHISMSVTKSFTGTLAAMLIGEGALDADAKVARYLPELAQSGFGDATVAEVLDMTTAIDFTENYEGQSPTMQAYRQATGFDPRREGEEGPQSVYAFLAAVPKQGAHGERFTYRTPNVDVISWLIARVTGKPVAAVLSERIWSRIGAEDDAFLQVDPTGVPLAGSAFNARLRDLARFGEVMRLGGAWNGQQVVPAAVVTDIRRGASREGFAKAGYATLPGWSYHNFWWVSHDDHGAFTARGIHGQAIYVDPKAEMVIARFASHPLAGNVNLDPTSLPAYRAVADHLIRHSR